MRSSIFDDAHAKPHLFRWNGAIVSQRLADWSRKQSWRIPPDLSEFWARTGGGIVFETETLLKPIVGADDEKGVEQATDWLKGRGMPNGFFVIHEGLCLTVVRYEDGAYLTLDDRARIAGLYDSFDNWYVQVVRAEYGERYGLTRRE